MVMRLQEGATDGLMHCLAAVLVVFVIAFIFQQHCGNFVAESGQGGGGRGGRRRRFVAPLGFHGARMRIDRYDPECTPQSPIQWRPQWQA